MLVERIAIIGAGPAGVSAAVQCERLGVTPVLLERSGKVGGLIENAFRVDNYPGLSRGIPGVRFVRLLETHLRRFQLKCTEASVIGIRPHSDGLELRLEEETFRAKAVILATGSQARQLEIPGEPFVAGRFLFYEVRHLLGACPSARDVAVIGSGEAACDYSLSLASRGIRVSLLSRGPALKARGHLLRACCRHPFVRVFLQVRCLEVGALAAGVSLLLRQEDRPGSWEGDAVLVAVGRQAQVPLLEGDRSLVSQRGVMNPFPGIYVVGDARLGSLGQLGIAVGDGLAGAAAAVAYVEGS